MISHGYCNHYGGGSELIAYLIEIISPNIYSQTLQIRLIQNQLIALTARPFYGFFLQSPIRLFVRFFFGSENLSILKTLFLSTLGLRDFDDFLEHFKSLLFSFFPIFLLLARLEFSFFLHKYSCEMGKFVSNNFQCEPLTECNF